MPAKTTPVVHRLCAALLVALAAPVAAQAQEASKTPDTPSVKTLDQITVNVANSSRRAEEARSVAVQANASAAHSGQVVANAVDAMQRMARTALVVGRRIDATPAGAAVPTPGVTAGGATDAVTGGATGGTAGVMAGVMAGRGG